MATVYHASYTLFSGFMVVVYNIKSQSSRLVSLTPRDDWGGAGLLGVTIRLDNYAGAQERLIRVLSVEPKSPAAIAGLVPLKDFLLGTSHQTLDSTATLAALLRQNQDAVMELYVYNCDSDVVRVVALLPTRQWEGVGLLGAEVGMGYLHRLPSSVRHTEGTSVERKVRYVGVKPNEPRPTKPVLMVELEPQLEMEPAPHEEDEDVSTRDLLSVQLSEDANDDSGQMNADLAPKMPERLTSDDANQLDKQQKETFDNGSKGHTETPILDDQTEIREKPPASHAQHTEQVVPFLPPPPNKPSDSGARRPSLEPVHRSAAEDVFGKPPPPAANTFFPPPPKMHFESPPPKDV